MIDNEMWKDYIVRKLNKWLEDCTCVVESAVSNETQNTEMAGGDGDCQDGGLGVCNPLIDKSRAGTQTYLPVDRSRKKSYLNLLIQI